MKMFSAHVHPALTQRVSEQHLCSFEVRNELLKKVLMAFHLQFWKKTVALYSALWFDHSLHTSDVMILFLTTGQSKALHFLINASYEERQMVLSAQVRTLQDRNPISYLWLFFFSPKEILTFSWPPGLRWKLIFIKNFVLLQTIQLFLLSNEQQIILTDMSSLPYATQNSFIFPLSHDFWLPPQFIRLFVFSQLSWKCEVSGEQRHCN